MNISMEYYKVFYYVKQTGSITAAAEILCISQPAVSQAVKALETALGSRLFVRTSKGVSLTREGEMLGLYVDRGMKSLLDGEEMLKRMASLDVGEVRIGASDMTLQFYLLPFLEKFYERCPNIKVTVSNAPTPETVSALEEGKIDFGVVTTPLEERPGISQYQTKAIQDIFVAGDKYSYLKGQILDYECLKELPCIFLEKNTSTRRFTDAVLEGFGVRPEPEFELATSDMIVQFAKRNLGVGCVMSEFAKGALEDGSLFQLQFSREMPKRHICVVTGKVSLISQAGLRLLQLLQE
ncbi:MAG: LysR family transcriptional regulator [Lachnospiraceae bacterium]